MRSGASLKSMAALIAGSVDGGGGGGGGGGGDVGSVILCSGAIGSCQELDIVG